SPLGVEQFDDYVRELMPDWVKDVIREQSPESDDNLDDLQSDLQKLLDEFRVPTVTLSSTRKPSGFPTAFSDEGTDTSEPVNMDAEFDGLLDEIDRTDENDRDAKSQRAKEKKVRKAPEGA